MTVAIQDRLPGNNCYGCGPDNPEGMQIKSYFDGTESVCEYMPRPSQCAGPEQFVYGGTIASLIDCHCVCTAAAHQYQLENREVGEGDPIWCVTGRLDVSFLEPTPIGRPVRLVATIAESAGKKTTLKCTVTSDGTPTAEGTVIAIRVPPSWRNQTGLTTEKNR